MLTIKRIYLWLCFHIAIFLGLSSLYSRSIFTEKTDGFFSQMVNLDFNTFDILSSNHIIRYIVISPFLLFLDYIQIQHLILVIYLIPLFLMQIPIRFKYLNIFLLYLSIFFSYRTILVMEAILILILYINFETSRRKKYLIFSLLLSLLSSGTFVIWLLTFYFFRKNIISNQKFLKYLNIFSLLLFILLLGPILHKILFFINPELFGDAKSVTIQNLFNIKFKDILILFENIFERSMIYEAVRNNDIIRLTISFIMFIFISTLLFSQKNKLMLLISLFYFFGLFLEGLVIYSLFFVTFVLFSDYLYRNLKVYFVKKNIY
ncbi:hypothetical protein CRV00_12075 [Malaciobacter molluscorum]|nr:hypothetical protein CRV00_12075 [Malaciobacter molluscorum]